MSQGRNDAEVVAARRKEHLDAFNRADVDGMAEVVAEDIVTMPPNIRAFEGKEACRSWWQQGFDAARSHFEVIPTELEVAGDWAYDLFTWSMESTPHEGGEAAHDRGNCVFLWRRGSDDSWRLARAIWNSDNEAAPGIWSGAART